MATPELKNNGWISMPWAEFTSRTGSTQEASFGYQSGNQAMMSILVEWDLQIYAIREILGHHIFNRFTGYLERTLPVRHPVYDWLYAERITSCRPIRFRSKGTLRGRTTSQYDFALLTIQFTQPRHVILSDADLDRLYGAPRQEWRRYVEVRLEPSGEMLSRDEGAFKYAETVAGGPSAGDKVRGSVAQFISKITHTLVWKRVPMAGLFSSDGFGLPTNVLNAVGTVNNASFMGFDTGTLLLQPPRFLPLEAPMPPWLNALDEGRGQPSLVYDVELPVVYFKPTSGGGTYQGHNLAPWPGATSGGNKWYLISHDGTAGGNRIFPSSDWTNIFKLLT